MKTQWLENILAHYENDGATVQSVRDDVSEGLFEVIAGEHMSKELIENVIFFMQKKGIITGGMLDGYYTEN